MCVCVCVYSSTVHMHAIMYDNNNIMCYVSDSINAAKHRIVLFGGDNL